MYTFLGLGISLCVITCTGHVAAETANGCCLYLVSFFLKSFDLDIDGLTFILFYILHMLGFSSESHEKDNLNSFPILKIPAKGKFEPPY